MPPTITKTTDEKLDEIVTILDHMNRRDRMRMIGGTVRSILTLIPLVLVLWSAWYFSQHSAALMKMIADQAAKSAAAYSQKQSSGMLDEFMKKYSPKQ